MPSRKNKRFAKKKGKASLKKTFSKKRIVGGLNTDAFALSINPSNIYNNQTSVEPAPMGDVKNDANVSTLESTTPTVSETAPGPPSTLATETAPGPPSTLATAPVSRPEPAPEPAQSSIWTSFLSNVSAPVAPQTGDSPEAVNMLANTGELEKLKEMVERNPTFKDGVTGFFPIPAISRAFDGIIAHGNNITEPENIKRADIILYLISKGANTSSITATSASPEVMKYIIGKVLEKDKNNSIGDLLRKIPKTASNIKNEIVDSSKQLTDYNSDINILNENFNEDKAKELLISISKDGTVKNFEDFFTIFVGDESIKNINEYLDYKNKENKTPLMVACENNNPGIVKKMLSTEPISKELPTDIASEHISFISSPNKTSNFIHYAAATYNIKLMEIIIDGLKKKTDIFQIIFNYIDENGDTAFSIICKKSENHNNTMELIKLLKNNNLIPDTSIIDNRGFNILEEKFFRLNNEINSTEFPSKTQIFKDKLNDSYKNCLELFDIMDYNIYNTIVFRFAQKIGFEQIYLQMWDTLLKGKITSYNSNECKRISRIRSCDYNEEILLELFNRLLKKIEVINKSLDEKHTVTYKSVCDAIQKKYGIFGIINSNNNRQFVDVDKQYFRINSGNTTVTYEEEYDEIRNPVDKYVAEKFEEEFLKLVDKSNLTTKTKNYTVKSKLCKSFSFKTRCIGDPNMKDILFFNKPFTELINKISGANTEYKKLNQPEKYITYNSIANEIIARNKIGIKEYDFSIEKFNELMEICFPDVNERPKNVGYDKHPEAPSMFSGLWSKGGKSSNTHKRKHAQKQKNTRKHK